MSKLVVGELVNDYFTKYSQTKVIQENESKLSDAIGELSVTDNGVTTSDEEDDKIVENVLVGLSILGSGAAAKRALRAYNS